MTDMTPSATNGQAAQTKAAAVKNPLRTNTGFAAHGLYDPRNEHDACGVGFIVNMKGVKSHQIVKDGLAILENLTHRGAVGADPLMGDGAGILVQIPDRFFREEMAAQGIDPAARRASTASATSSCRRTQRCAPISKTSSPNVAQSEGPAAPRLPRRAGRQFVAVEGARHRRDRAVPPSGLHRPHSRHSATTRNSSARLYHAAQGDLGPHLRRERQRGHRLLSACRCRRAPSSTRACSWPTRSAPITRI